MMTPYWLSTFVLLVLTGLKRHSAVSKVHPCAEIYTATPLVAHGSSLSASCVIAEDCPWTEVQWRFNDELLQASVPANQSSRIAQIVIRNFSEPSGYLTCSICHETDCQIVDGLHIMSGYPPSAPQNLSCQTNLTQREKLHCRWTPGPGTDIPTNYTFHTQSSLGLNCYPIPTGVNHITIPRSEFSFFSKIQVYVKAQNALGQATSQHLRFKPIAAAKFDPPVIEWVKPNKYGCLSHSWRLHLDQNYLKTEITVELHLKPVDSTVTGNEKFLVKNVRDKKDIEVCGLLHGMAYQAQIRVCYKTSPWSEWSNWARGCTLVRAPTGSLDTWLRVTGEAQNSNIVKLAWKPSKQFRANGRPLSYYVSLTKSSAQRRICVTNESYCVVRIPKGARKVYLTAQNPAGRSRPMEVRVYTNTALPRVSSLSVLPHGAGALDVHWSSPPASSPPTGYVVESRQLHDDSSSFIAFHLANRSQTSALLSDGFEPYTPYEISVYPKYAEGVGLPLTQVAYTRQGAPSVAPLPNLIWKSRAELTWDEIPMTERNGIIQSYQIFYWDEHGQTNDIKVLARERRVILKDLKPLTTYQAFIMVSTCNGSRNGTIVTLNTGSANVFGIVLIGVPTCVGITLVFIIIMLTSLAKHKWLKRCLWPKIPDPANSSIRKWSTTELLQEGTPQKNSMEPVLVFLSHFSVVDLTERHLEKLIQSSKERWLCNEGDTNLYSCGSSQASSPFDTDVTSSESVPYATLVFSGGYRGQPPLPPPPDPPLPPPAYLRSESTQPLLEEEEPQSPDPLSPLPYRNMLLQVGDPGDAFRECEEIEGGDKEQPQLWEDFPLLNSLAIKDV
ncbi:hypothetical protein ACEWY4_020453 [Coilia grayii]|uniref:Granulocyte colony-stimulating factor receptor n=1 Tax=Coilia grayii TaxID=363190 RepID=A0ABD1JCM2_9TELE